MSSKVQIKWFGGKATRRIERIMWDRLDQSAELVKSQVMRNLLAKPTWPAGRNIPPYKPSKPGEIPHVDRTRLSKTIFWDRPSKFVRRIGTPLKYGLFLQVGTRTIKARPYLDVTLRQNMARIKAILTARIK